MLSPTCAPRLVTRLLSIASAQLASRRRRLADQVIEEPPSYGHRTLVVLGNVNDTSSGLCGGAGGYGRGDKATMISIADKAAS